MAISSLYFFFAAAHHMEMSRCCHATPNACLQTSNQVNASPYFWCAVACIGGIRTLQVAIVHLPQFQLALLLHLLDTTGQLMLLLITDYLRKMS
jgi:hypothetical protein